MKLLLSTCCAYCLSTKIDRQRDEVRNDDEMRKSTCKIYLYFYE